MERRQFLKISGAVSLAATLGPVGLTTALADPGTLSRDTFVALQERWFLFFDPSWSHYSFAQLQAVEEIPVDLNVDQFSLLFRSGYKRRLPAGLYEVYTQTGSYFQLYIEPIESDGPEAYYIAYFALLQ